MNKKGIVLIIGILCAVLRLHGYTIPYHTYVFNGGEDGYECYRIPAVVRANNGNLIAFAEGRVNGISDNGDIDIVHKISTNGGYTWSSLASIVSAGTSRVHDPVPVVDRDTGKIYLFFCVDTERMYSVETYDGVSWGNLVDRTYLVSSYLHATSPTLHTGPGSGIQLTTGQYDGRLIFPIWHKNTAGTVRIRLIYSDDHGASWTASPGVAKDGSESQIVELESGNIYFNARNISVDEYDDSTKYRRCGTTPHFLTTGLQLNLDTTLVEPTEIGGTEGCHGSVMRVATQAAGGYSHIIFANPSTKSERRFLRVRSSYDETDDWTIPKLLNSGLAGYSDMVEINNDNIGILYENGDSYYQEKIAFTRFGKGWLTESEISSWDFYGVALYQQLASTVNNRVVIGADATCYGNPRPTVYSGAFGGDTRSISLKGAEYGQYLEISNSDLNRSCDFSNNESFAVEMMIGVKASDHGPGKPYGALIAKDVGTNEPSWWVRIQDGEVRFFVCDGPNSSSVMSSTGATITDFYWKHIKCVRDSEENKLKIYVNGVLKGSADDTTTGSFNNQNNIRIGRFNSNSHKLTGFIDSVIIHQYQLDMPWVDSQLP